MEKEEIIRKLIDFFLTGVPSATDTACVSESNI
jgi:hypothetical protein